MQRTKLMFAVRQAFAITGGVCLLGYGAQGEAQTSTPMPGASTSEATPAYDASVRPARKSDDKKSNDKKKMTEGVATTVTGQLAAIRRAQSIKRDAVNVVDSISAEEAGKFPDPNVADALQRVPGVAVNRSGGESSQIGIRGFGPASR